MSGKYAYIDSFRVRSEFPTFKDAQSQFDEELQQWNFDLESERNSIIRMESELAEESLLFSDSEQRDKANAIAARKTALQNRASEIFGPNGQAEKRNRELIKPILEVVNRALEVVAGNNGYDMILDSINGNIAFALKEINVTELVLQELEKAK